MPDPVSDSCDWDFPKEVMVNAVLYLPLGSKPKDETVGSWSGFAHIEETDYSGIGSVAAERTVRVVACHGMLTVEGFGNGEAVTAYDMNGRIVYIVTGGSLCSQSW